MVAERLASALPSAWPSTIAVSSMVWWPSISMSPLACTVRSRLAWLPSEVSMWSKNGTPVSTSTTPVPSRFSSTTMSDSLVLRSIFARRGSVTVLLLRRVRSRRGLR
jgi:hypothetical protein